MKEKLLFLLTCTSLELMTAIGVTLYLTYLGEVTLALISLVIFSKVIVFHFAFDYYDKRKKGQFSKKLPPKETQSLFNQV